MVEKLCTILLTVTIGVTMIVGVLSAGEPQQPYPQPAMQTQAEQPTWNFLSISRAGVVNLTPGVTQAVCEHARDSAMKFQNITGFQSVECFQ